MSIKASQTAQRAGQSIIAKKAEELTKVDDVLKDENQAGQVAFDLCVDSLCRGCVMAFCEFFSLSHREPVCVDPLANRMFKIPETQLPTIQETLIKAEETKRNGEFREVYDQFIQLANYFEDEKDYNTSLHFHQQGLDNAKASSEKDLEGVAYENFGNAHQRLGNTVEAIAFHESHLRLAEASRNATMKYRADFNLFRIYMIRAQELEKENELEGARTVYQKAVTVAQSNSDRTAEGDAYHKLGEISEKLGQLDQAMEYQRQYLVLAQQSQSGINEGKAQSSLARLQEDLGMVNDAINSLQLSLEIAEEKEDAAFISECCTKLGLLHNKQGNYQVAVQYLQQNYRMCKTLDSKAEKRARMLCGLALGNDHWTAGFVKTATTDLEKMLDWKCSGELYQKSTKSV